MIAHNRSRRLKRPHTGADFPGVAKLDTAHVVAVLQVDPEKRIHAEKQPKRIGDFGLDRALAFDDFIDRRARDTRASRQLGLGNPKLLEKFFHENAARRGRENGCWFGGHGHGWVSGNR